MTRERRFQVPFPPHAQERSERSWKWGPLSQPPLPRWRRFPIQTTTTTPRNATHCVFVLLKSMAVVKALHTLVCTQSSGKRVVEKNERRRKNVWNNLGRLVVVAEQRSDKKLLFSILYSTHTLVYTGGNKQKKRGKKRKEIEEIVGRILAESGALDQSIKRAKAFNDVDDAKTRAKKKMKNRFVPPPLLRNDFYTTTNLKTKLKVESMFSVRLVYLF